MKTIGITRVRNEEKIIKNTLDHVSKFVDEIIVLDDDSTDKTNLICRSHKKVSHVIENSKWSNDPSTRMKLEGTQRQELYNEALRRGADWVYCFDADEYIEPGKFSYEHDAYFFRLFDFYITPFDVDSNYLERKYIGPEFRDIPMLFKANPNLTWLERVPRGFNSVAMGGYCRHYGKAISVQEWEDTCDYYATYFPKYAKKWEARKGKAVHVQSDFGRDLITWDDRKNSNLIVKIG